MTDLEGSRSVGRYRILDFLGSAAMGEVFLAEDPQIERRLAIKTVRLAGRRDIKPSNILLEAQGKVKVADFGIAKVTGQSTKDKDRIEVDLQPGGSE